jgi:homoserine O-acetyltransferase
MDWQTPEDTVPSAFITEANSRALLGKPPASGAWRVGDPPGNRQFLPIGAVPLEDGGVIPSVRISYETFGTLNSDRSNAVLVLHALTGDSHLVGAPGNGHATAGWWGGIVGPGLAIDTTKWFVVAPNMLGGCQGSTGPSSYSPDGTEWGTRFPFITIRDQVTAQVAFADALGIERWAAAIGGSMGGMHVLEWAIGYPDRVDRIAILAAPETANADQIATASIQKDVIRMDPAFAEGHYYDAADGDGPHRGLALARRIALLSYRSPGELNDRFARTWQSGVTPLGGGDELARRGPRPRRCRCRPREGDRPRAGAGNRHRPPVSSRTPADDRRTTPEYDRRRSRGDHHLAVRPRRFSHRKRDRRRSY